MSQPSGRPPAGAEVNVPIGAILAARDERWGRLVQLLVGENSELQAGVEAQGQELAYLRSVVAAQEEQDAGPGPQEAPAGPESPGALG